MPMQKGRTRTSAAYGSMALVLIGIILGIMAATLMLIVTRKNGSFYATSAASASASYQIFMTWAALVRPSS